MNYPRSCRQSYPQPSNLNVPKSQTSRRLSSNSDSGTYEIEISEGVSAENNSYKENNLKDKKNDCPYFESYYPNFFPESNTDSSVDKKVYEVPKLATYYCEQKNCPSKPKKCNHVRLSDEVQCQTYQDNKICPPRCMTQRSPQRELCKKQGESSKSKGNTKKNEVKLPPCDCKDCNDDRCDGFKSSRTYTVSSRESIDQRSKSREGTRGENSEQRKKEGCRSQPYFQHFIEKLCSEGEKDKSMSRPRSLCEHDDCPCYTTNDRLKEVNKRIEALEAVYSKQRRDSNGDSDSKKSQERRRSRYDDDEEALSTKKESRREIVRKHDDEDHPKKMIKKETKREMISKYEEKEQPKKVRKESKKEITKLDEDPKRVKTESLYVESRYETTEDEDNTSADRSPDPDFAKTAEEIENELLEIRRRLQKLESIHTAREKVKASAVPAAVTTKKEVPVFTTVMYNPEAQWHQVTEITENEAKIDENNNTTTTNTTTTTITDTNTITDTDTNTNTNDNTTNNDNNNLVKENVDDLHEKSLEEKISAEETLSEFKYEHEHDKSGESVPADCPCCCCKSINEKKRPSETEEEEDFEKESHSNQKIKENFMIVCKILRNKLSYLLRSDKRKRKSTKTEVPKISSESNLSSDNISTKKFTSRNSSESFQTSKSLITTSGTRILYQRDYINHLNSNLTYTKGDATTSSTADSAPLPPVCIYNSDETPTFSNSDKTYICDGNERIRLQYNAEIDENRMNEMIYYLASGDSSSNSRISIKNLKEYYFSPNIFDFESDKNCPFPKYKKKSEKSPFYEKYDDREEIIYTANDESPRFKNQECQCVGLESKSKVVIKKNEENHPVVVKGSKIEKGENNPFEFLASEGLIKIPVLFEELCKKSTAQHPDSKVSMKVVLVALAEAERKEKDTKTLVRNFSNTESSDDRKKFVFGVSKCDCEQSGDMERSSYMPTQGTRSSAQLFMASRESLKSNELIPIENEPPISTKMQTNQKSIKCRCCHCNGEYPCPNVLNHVDPPNLVGLKRTLKDLGFSSLSEKLNDKIDFTKIIKKTQAVYSAPLNKIRKKREVSLSKSDEKIKSYISELAESLKGSKNFCQCQLQHISLGPESVSQLPFDEESRYSEMMKRKEIETHRMRYEPSDVPIKIQSEISDAQKGTVTDRSLATNRSMVTNRSMTTNRTQTGKLPVIAINIKTTIYGDPPTVKEFDVTTEETPQHYEPEPKRRISSQKSIRGIPEVSQKSFRKQSGVSSELELVEENFSSSKNDIKCLKEVCTKPQEDSRKSVQLDPSLESSRSLELTIEDESSGSLPSVTPEESVPYQGMIASKDSVEIVKKRKFFNGQPKKTSIVVTPEEEIIMRRLRELESRLTTLERSKPDENEITRENNSIAPSERSVKFSKNNHAKTVFLALFRPFRYHKNDDTGRKVSKTKVFLKSSVDKLYGLKARFSKSKDVKEEKEKIPEDIVDGLIDDCSRSSPPLTKRKVPLVMESVEPIRAGKKSKKKKKKAKSKEDKEEKKSPKVKKKKKRKFL